MTATESVGNTIQRARGVLDDKCELLKVGNPRCMARGDLTMRTQMLQCVMVGIKNKLAMKKIVTPMLNGLDYGIEFDVISTVTQAWIGQLLTKERDMAILLTQHGAYTRLGSICMYLEDFVKVRQS